MSKFNITHSCGHEVEHQLFGPTKDRERKAEWLESVPCMECNRKHEAEERALQNDQAAQANRDIGAVALTGSEKQIGWAETLRRQGLVAVANAIAGVEAAPDNEVKGLVLVALKGTISWLLLEKSEAQWWIENVGNLRSTRGPAALFGMLAGKLPAASENEILRHIMLESPVLTESVADLLGVGAEFRARVAARAAAAAKSDLRKELEAKKPVAPEFWKEIGRKHADDWHCNGKIYSGNRVYVSNTEYRLTPDQSRDLQAYWSAKAAWSAEMTKLS